MSVPVATATPAEPDPETSALRGPAAAAPSAPMDHHEKMRIRAAAFRATRIYPGPVGELISRELLSWEDFGYRLGGDRLIMALVADVLKTPPGA